MIDEKCTVENKKTLLKQDRTNTVYKGEFSMDANNMWQQNQPAQEQNAYQYYQPASNMMGTQSIPADAGNKKKSGKGPVIAIVLILLVLLLGVGGFCLYQFVFNTPEARLAKGLATFAQDLSACGSCWQETAGLTELMQNMEEENNSTMDVKLDITLPEMETIGVDFYQNFDGENRRLDAELALSFFNVKLLEAELAADSEKLYVSVPDIVDKWYSLNTETLGADYQGSIWEEILGMNVPEDYKLSLFPGEIEGNDAALQEELKELTEEYTPKFAEHATIEDSDNVVEIKRDGKTIRCEGVRVTIEKEVLNDFLEDFFALYEEYYGGEDIDLSGELKSDVELCFYMDNKNRIVNISTPKKIKFTDSNLEAIGFSLVFSGTENTLDEISGNGEIEVTEVIGEDIGFEIERSTESTDSTFEDEWIITMEGESENEVVMELTSAMDLDDLSFECNLVTESGDAMVELVWQGAYTDVEQGESVTVEIDKISVAMNGEEMFKITGSIAMGILEEKIEIPEDAADLMGLTDDELLEVITGFSDYISKYEEFLY